MDDVDPTWLLQSKLLLPKGNKISSIYKMKNLISGWINIQGHIFSSMCLILLMTWHHRHAQYMLQIESNFYFIFKFPFLSPVQLTSVILFTQKSKNSSYLGEFQCRWEASLIAESKEGKMSSGHIKFYDETRLYGQILPPLKYMVTTNSNTNPQHYNL